MFLRCFGVSPVSYRRYTIYDLRYTIYEIRYTIYEIRAGRDAAAATAAAAAVCCSMIICIHIYCIMVEKLEDFVRNMIF